MPIQSRVFTSVNVGTEISPNVGVGGSASTPELLRTIADRTRSASVVLDLLVPFGRGDVLAEAHRAGSVLEERPGEAGMLLTTRLPVRHRDRFEEFVVE